MTTTPAPHSTRELTSQEQQWLEAGHEPPPPPSAPGGGYDGTLYQTSWGSIRLFASMFHTDNSRTQVVHDLSNGDVHPVQDRGLRARRVRVNLLFDDFTAHPDQGQPLDSFREFKAAVDSGARAIFGHPVEGNYLACVGEFTYEIDEHSGIANAVAEFIAEEEPTGIEPGTLLVGALDGGAVAKAADQVDIALAQLGLLGSSPALDAVPNLPPVARRRLEINRQLSLNFALGVGVDVGVGVNASVSASASASASARAEASASARADASARASASANARASANASASASANANAAAAASLSASASAAASAEIALGQFASLTVDGATAVESWSWGAPTRQITNDVARVSSNIATAIEVGRLESDLQLWPALRALILFGDAVRNAAVAATSETPSVFVMRVTSPVALLPLAARVYGGADARDRARQIMALNDVRSPGWLDPGDYILPARSPAQRSPF